MPAFFPLEGDDEENGPKRAFFNSLVEDAAGMAPAAFTEVAQAVSTWNRFEHANRLTLPTQLIWGELDQIVEREAMTRSLIAIPGANNLEVIRGVGHSPMIEAPLALAELLIDFITDDFAGYEEIRGSVDDPEATPRTMTTGTAHSAYAKTPAQAGRAVTGAGGRKSPYAITIICSRSGPTDT